MNAHASPSRFAPGPTAARRQGFTILEVLLAMFVVATAAVLLSEGYTQNLRAINANRVDTTLALLAGSKMAEIAAGVVATDVEPDGTFEDEGYPDYEWHVEILATETAGLSQVDVTVAQATEQGRREFTLHRLVYQPESVLGSLP